MQNYLLILPVALLVSYSQLIVKWRSNSKNYPDSVEFTTQLINLLKDPVILSAYGAGLFASFAWLYVVTRLPLTVAFPIYIGITFALTICGGWFFLAEPMSTTKVIAILMILGGIVLGARADA